MPIVRPAEVHPRSSSFFRLWQWVGSARRQLPVQCGLAVFAFLWMVAPGCRNGNADAGPHSVDMKIGDRMFHLWIAAKDQARQTGLMNRPSMPADRGMIFVFRDEAPRSFYMKNTLIPLDIIYLGADGRVGSILRMDPEARARDGNFILYPSDAPMKYAIELNAGAAADCGVKVGQVIDVPEAARQPADLE